MSNKKVLGIDLGTTNSCVAVIEGGISRVIENFEGQRVTPSVVAFSHDGQVIVGDAAKRQAHGNVKRTIYEFKRLMGKKVTEIQDLISKLSYQVVAGSNGEAEIKIDNKQYSPSYISGLLLRKLVDDSCNKLGYQIKDVVITVPAHFDDAQRHATKNAAEIVGLNVVRIINEPTAAAMAYSVDKLKSGNILVYDLGGGTFDVTLLNVDQGLFQVINTGGDTKLGGADFDNEILQYAIQCFKNTEKIDLLDKKQAPNTEEILHRIKEASEIAKKTLSNNNEANIYLPFILETKSLNCKITKAKFESMIEKYINKANKITQEIIDQSNLKVDKIDKIVCVGGSTRVPLARETLQKQIGKIISLDINPDEAVALGAAIQGGVLSGDVSDVVLLDVTPLSLGIEAVGGVFAKVIDRNTPIPTSKSKIFTTTADGQTSAQITIFQGERNFVKDNKKLGSFELLGIKSASRGEPQIEVTFHIDANGIMQISAKDLSSNSEQKIILTPESGLSKEDIEKLIKDAEEQKNKDEEELKKVEQRNQLENSIYSIEKVLKENKEKLEENYQSYISQLEEIKVIDDIEIAIEKCNKLLSTIYSKISGSQNESNGFQDEPKTN